MSKVTRQDLDRLNRQHVVTAIGVYDAGVRLATFYSKCKRYQLIFNKRVYPPTHILGMAISRLLGREVKSKDVYEINASAIVEVYRALGFTIGINPNWSYRRRVHTGAILVGVNGTTGGVGPVDAQGGAVEPFRPVNRLSVPNGHGAATVDARVLAERAPCPVRVTGGSVQDTDAVEVSVKVDNKTLTNLLVDKIRKMDRQRLEKEMIALVKTLLA